MAIFTGAAVALITPMKPNGDVNFDKLGELIDDQIKRKTDSIVICGTTGEASTLTHDEHLEVIRYCVDRTAKRVPVIAGTGSNCTETAKFLSKKAEEAGADGLLVVSPYYNKATQGGLEANFKAIAATVDIPVILYNIPGRTGCTIQPATIAKLVKEVDNIVGVKSALDEIGPVVQLMHLCNGEIDLYSGNDGDQIVPIMSLGGKGVISVLSHVIPEDTHNIVEKFLNGDTKGSLELQLKYLPLIKALFSEVNPIPVKKAMNLLGWEVGSLRMPLTEMEDANAKVLEAEMRKVGLLK